MPPRPQISKLLTTVISPFLLLRSISNLALTIIYVYLAHDEQKSLGVITAVLVGMTSIVVYTGLVVVGFEKDWDVRIDPGRGDNAGQDVIENIVQQFVTVGR
jgi:hypothetical protein